MSGLGCSPPTAALLKCNVLQISVFGVIQEREEENRGLYPGLGLSHYKMLALSFLLPEQTSCMVLVGAQWLGGQASLWGPRRLALLLCMCLGLAEATLLHCLPCLLVLSSEPVETCPL